MTQGLLSIGSSALDAAYTALRTTGNNIANVNTPGYSREITTFTPQISTGVGNMYIGTGVSVQSVSRVYSDFLAQQTNLAQSQSSQADSAAQLTGQINSLFSNTSTSLGAAMDSFFAQLQGVAAQPSSAAARQTALSSAQQMASQFNDFAAQLQTMNQSATQQLSQEVATVNSTVAQIASLNDQISLVTASGGSPNSLLDERNQAILTLNKSVGVTTNTQSNGATNIYLANGQPLLVGDKTFALGVSQDPTNSQMVAVGTSNGGTIIPLDPGNSGGGTIGALLQFQDQTIPGVENQVGRLAVVLSSQVNSLQAQGIDLNGQAGSSFFSTPSISVTASPTNGDSVSPSASYADVTQLQASNYRLSFQGASGAYTLTRLSDGSTVTGTLPTSTSASTPGVINADGMNLSFTAIPGNADIFNISPVQLGATNLNVAITQGAQIAAASPMQATLGSGNSGSLMVGNLALAPLPANPDPNLQQAITVQFTNPTSYYTYPTGSPPATPPATLSTYTPGQAIDLNGWSLTLTGSPASGDTVNVAANATSGTVSGDSRNALLLTQLQGQQIVSGATLDNAYSAAVADVGALASNANTDQASKSAILQTATTSQSAVSGVNLDEEAAALMQFQQQYQAAAKIIQTATNVFDAILAVAGAA